MGSTTLLKLVSILFLLVSITEGSTRGRAPYEDRSRPDYYTSSSQSSVSQTKQFTTTQFRYYDNDPGTPSTFNQGAPGYGGGYGQGNAAPFPPFPKPALWRGPKRGMTPPGYNKAAAAVTANREARSHNAAELPGSHPRYADGTPVPSFYLPSYGPVTKSKPAPYSPPPPPPTTYQPPATTAAAPYEEPEQHVTNVLQNIYHHQYHTNVHNTHNNAYVTLNQPIVPPAPHYTTNNNLQQQQIMYVTPSAAPYAEPAPAAPLRYAEYSPPVAPPSYPVISQPEPHYQPVPVYSHPPIYSHPAPAPAPYQYQPTPPQHPPVYNAEHGAYSENHESVASLPDSVDEKPLQVDVLNQPQVDQAPAVATEDQSPSESDEESAESALYSRYAKPRVVSSSYSGSHLPQRFIVPILPKFRSVSPSPATFAGNEYYTHSTYAAPYKNFAHIEYLRQRINPDTSYDVEFKSGNGIHQQESGYMKTIPGYSTGYGYTQPKLAHVKTGSYSWTSPEGIPFSISYIADENGFRPIGRHLPKINDSYGSTNYETLSSDVSQTVVAPEAITKS